MPTPARFSMSSLLNGLAAVMMIGASATIIWSLTVNRGSESVAGSTPEKRPAEPISLEDAPIRGELSAKVAIIEYGDFVCPACAQFARTTMPGLRAKYIDTGQVLFAFKHLPLEQIHSLARYASEAAACAGRQGLFWKVYDAQYAAAPALDVGGIRQIAEAGGVDLRNLDRCLSTEARDLVDADLAEATRLGFRSTPTFVFGDVRSDGHIQPRYTIAGTGAPEKFWKIIEAALKAHNARVMP